MPEHPVAEQDCIATIARQHGYADWRNLWNDGGNSALRTARTNANQLVPGDVVQIPDNSAHIDNAATDAEHSYKIPSLPTKLRVRLLDLDNHPIAGKRYEIRLDGDDAQKFSGTTGGDGKVEQVIPPDAQMADLTVWIEGAGDEGMTWQLILGTVLPVEDLRGVKARLRNLGYMSGEPDDQMTPETEAALRAFQGKNGLTATGAVDDPTRAKLKQLHDEVA